MTCAVAICIKSEECALSTPRSSNDDLNPWVVNGSDKSSNTPFTKPLQVLPGNTRFNDKSPEGATSQQLRVGISLTRLERCAHCVPAALALRGPFSGIN